MNMDRFWHICEGCGKKELLTPDEAFNKGWDYPPRMGTFGVLSPRTCGNCRMQDTLWWKVVMDKAYLSRLSEDEKTTLKRIIGEPGSLQAD